MSRENVRVAIDCDDAAVELKKIIYNHMISKGIAIDDLNYAATGNNTYPEIGYNLALKIKAGEYDRGILICGTGLGMAMIANKVEGVYAGVCHDAFSAERLAKSNNAQVLTMGARVIGSELAKIIVDVWMNSEFEGGRSLPKVEKMHLLEKNSFHRDA
jgi:ribose 5-phosphate isomerase B